MRQLLFALPLVLSLACSPAPEPAEAPPETPAAEAAPEGQPMTTGMMGGYSTSASGEVAELTLAADALRFSTGQGETETFAVATTYLGAVDPSTPIAEGGDTFAAAAPSDTATRVELRRVDGPAHERLCGGMPASYAALVHAEPLTVLQLMVFSGADAPGPTARDTAICGIYAYAVD